MTMNATDAALELIHKAATALERHAQVTPEDIEEALDKAKNATKILKASSDLIQEGIFEVAKEPMPGTPLPFEEIKDIRRRA